MRRSIPISAPDLSGNEEQYVVEAIRSSWISSSGKFLERFEMEFGNLCEARHALAVSNGTVALHLALMGLDVRRGDEVIIPSLTYIATANAVRYVGGEPVFVDVDPETWCMDPKLLEPKVTRRTKGIIAVDLYGHVADMDAINEFAAVRGLWVVEDAAEAHFARYKGRRTGSLAKITTFSFYGNKIISCGEGGALTLNDDQLAVRLRSLRGQGMDPKRRYYFPITGYNFRFTNVASAILCGQLDHREAILNRRRQIFEIYRQGLASVPGIGFQPVAEWCDPAHWLFCLTIEGKKYGHSRDELIALLEKDGVDSRPFFIPLHRLPPFREESCRRNEVLPITDQLSAMGLNLPTYPGLTDEEVEHICGLVRRYAC